MIVKGPREAEYVIAAQSQSDRVWASLADQSNRFVLERLRRHQRDNTLSMSAATITAAHNILLFMSASLAVFVSIILQRWPIISAKGISFASVKA